MNVTVKCHNWQFTVTHWMVNCHRLDKHVGVAHAG